MPPITTCLPCQSRVLWRHFRSKRQTRHFISFTPEEPASEFQPKQEDIIPPKQAGEQKGDIPVWPSREARKRHTENSEDPREALLKNLFDANRHKNPQSAAFRYSRRPVEQTTQVLEHQTGSSLPVGSSSGRILRTRTPPRSYPKIPTTQGDKHEQFKNNGSGGGKSLSLAGESNIFIRRIDLSVHAENNKSNDSIVPARERERIATSLKNSESKSTRSTLDDLPSDSNSTQDTIPSEFSLGRSDPGPEYTEADNEVQTGETSKPRITIPWKPDPLSYEFRQGVRARDTRKTNELWQQFRELLNEEKFKSNRLDTLFADFLWGFSHLRKIQPLQEVWSCMIQQGTTPTIRHWNAVLEVLQKMRDLERFEATWKRMLDAGIKPDNQSWTIHIVILLEQPYKNWRSTLNLLDSMGQSWREAQAENASRTEIDTLDAQYLPSIVPVNATITGLLRLHHTDIARDVLEWAQSFSIKIDTTCHNIFLRYACQRGDTAGIDSIIKEMEKNGVKQDIVTKTILLDNLIRNPDSPLSALPPTEQKQVVVESLKQMSSEGDPPNAQTFAVTLHALLYQPKPNIDAARAVFQLLIQQRKGVSPHVYTILFMYHFGSENPDLKALDSLWKMIEGLNSKIDHVLYDRMIEGYANIGELDKMLAFFKKMTDAGQVPGWLALGRALAALTRKSEWKLCAKLVSDVTSDSGHLHVGKRGWKGEREFWQLVSELREQKLIPYEK